MTVTSALAAVLLLGSPFGGASGPALTSPTLLGGTTAAVVAWSGTSALSPNEAEIHARTVAPDGSMSATVRLTRAGVDGDAATRADVPAMLRRDDGRLLLVYTQRTAVSPVGTTLHGLRAAVVTADGQAGPTSTFGPDFVVANDEGAQDAAPALAWGPGRHWVTVVWSEPASYGARILTRRLDPDGRPLGQTHLLAAVPASDYGGTIPDWYRAAPAATSTPKGVVVVWPTHIDQPSAGLAGARIGPAGTIVRLHLRLDTGRQRRALGVRRGRIGQSQPALATDSHGRALLAWIATGPPPDFLFAGSNAVLMTRLDGTRRIVRVSDIELDGGTQFAPRIAIDPHDRVSVTWAYSGAVLGPRTCSYRRNYVRQLDQRLTPTTTPKALWRASDPRGPDLDNGDLTCPRQPFMPAATYVGSHLLAAWPISPFIEARWLSSSAPKTGRPI